MLADLARQYAPTEEAAGRAAADLEAYLNDLLSWTRDSNLVAASDLGRLASRHVAESLAALPLLDRLAPKRLVDLGSGGGFPAIPIKILRPELAVTLVESRRRKGLFLQRVIEGLELQHAQALVARAEKVDWPRGQLADVGTARAVAVIAELLPWFTPLVRPGGHVVLFKGSSHPEELEAWRATHDPAWTYQEVVALPDSHLFFVVFERTAHQPAGQPAD